MEFTILLVQSEEMSPPLKEMFHSLIKLAILSDAFVPVMFLSCLVFLPKL